MATDLYELALRFKSEGFTAVKKNLDTIDAQGKTLIGRFTSVASAFKGILSAGAVVAIGGFLKKSIDEASDAEAALSELRGAVGNVGGDFGKLAKSFDDSAQHLQRFTRFSDDETTRALAKLVTISGDTAGALKNIGLAADVAAFQQTDLNTAAELIGRTMTGNTKGLKQFGIATKDSTDGLEQLRQKMKGVAERDGATFQGRLEQLRNEFGNVLEAIGKVIIGGDDAADTMGRLAEKLRELSGWIEKNSESWHKWTIGLLDESGGPLAFLNKLQEKMQWIAEHAPHVFGNMGLSQQMQNRANQGFSDAGTFAPVVVTATKPGSGSGHSTPPPRGGTGKDKKEKDKKLFDPFTELVTSAMEKAAANIDKPEFDPLDAIQKRFRETPSELDAMLQDLQDTLAKGPIAKFREDMGHTISDSFAQTLGDAIYNAFSAAFNGEGIGGILKAFGKTILAGVGQLFTQLGMVYLEYGVLMQSLAALLPNPFTAGAAGIAIGAALIAMGAALGAVANGGGGRGTATAGAFREPRSGTTDIVRLKFVDRPGYGSQLSPATPIHFTVIGENDPKAQRMIGNIVQKNSRRQG